MRRQFISTVEVSQDRLLRLAIKHALQSLGSARIQWPARDGGPQKPDAANRVDRNQARTLLGEKSANLAFIMQKNHSHA